MGVTISYRGSLADMGRVEDFERESDSQSGIRLPMRTLRLRSGRTSMKNANMALAAVAALGIIAGFGRAAEVAAPGEPMSVWFVSPAKSFHESCPLGNGRLGAMDFGGVGRQRIVLNESSLWSGGPYDGNKYDAYQCLPEVREKLFAGDISGAGAVLNKSFRYADGVRGWMDVNQFGCYQTLGDLIVDFDNSPEPKLSSPSGHAPGDGKGIENTVDDNPGSKWCVNNGNTPVVWQMQFPEPQTVKSYAFTSGDDMPERDPRSWVLEGSADGKAWAEVDRHALDKPFENRHQTKTFEIARPAAFRFYRFTFAPGRSAASRSRRSASPAPSSRRRPWWVTGTAAI